MHINNMGVVVIDEQKCIGCKQCVQACPFGAIQMHPVTKKAIKCDLCGGKPKCVEICRTAHPPGVIRLAKPSDAGKFNRDRWADRLEKSIITAMQMPTKAQVVTGGEGKGLADAADKGDVA